MCKTWKILGVLGGSSPSLAGLQARQLRCTFAVLLQEEEAADRGEDWDHGESHGAVLLRAKPGAEKPQMVRKKKIKILKDSSVGDESRLDQDWVEMAGEHFGGTFSVGRSFQFVLKVDMETSFIQTSNDIKTHQERDLKSGVLTVWKLRCVWSLCCSFSLDASHAVHLSESLLWFSHFQRLKVLTLKKILRSSCQILFINSKRWRWLKVVSFLIRFCEFYVTGFGTKGLRSRWSVLAPTSPRGELRTEKWRWDCPVRPRYSTSNPLVWALSRIIDNAAHGKKAHVSEKRLMSRGYPWC